MKLTWKRILAVILPLVAVSGVYTLLFGCEPETAKKPEVLYKTQDVKDESPFGVRATEGIPVPPPLKPDDSNEPENEVQWVEYINAKHFNGRGEVEKRLFDGSRVDVYIDGYAVEADWDYKWKEAVGQALFYAKELDAKPAILILCKGGMTKDELLNIYRLLRAVDDIDVKVMVYDCKNKKWNRPLSQWHVNDEKERAASLLKPLTP